MIYNLNECATLYDDTDQAAEGALRQVIQLALTWDEERFDTARIETAEGETFGPDEIEEIARIENIGAGGAPAQGATGEDIQLPPGTLSL
jgi:hypothetical protein